MVSYSLPDVIVRLRCLGIEQKLGKTQMRQLREVIADAIKYLRAYEMMVDKQEDICNNVGNKYIFHADSELNDFDQGYNAGIRDALAILRKDVTT